MCEYLNENIKLRTYIFLRSICFVIIILKILVISETVANCKERNINTKGHIKQIVAHDFNRKAIFYPYHILNYLDFGKSLDNTLRYGWSSQGDKDSLWAVGNVAGLRFFLTDLKELNARIKCEPMIVKDHKQIITISINGYLIDKIELQNSISEYDFVISKHNLKLGFNFMDLTFSYAKSPKSLGISDDGRELAARFFYIDLDITRPNYAFGEEAVKDLGHIANVSRVKINNEIKTGIIQNPKSGCFFDKIYIPEKSSFSFSLGLHPAVKLSTSTIDFSVHFQVFNPDLSNLPANEIVFRDTIRLDGPRSWKHYEIDISKFAGKIVTIYFNLCGDVLPQNVVAVWADPKIVSTIPDKQHNVFLITFDALRKDRVGCYGYNKGTTPNLDAFAKDAVRYTNSRSNAPWTLPSFSSIYTSLFPKTHGSGRKAMQARQIEDMFTPLRTDFPTMPVFLKPFGYVTRLTTSHAYFDPVFGLERDFDARDKDVINIKKPLFVDEISDWLARYKDEKLFWHIHIIPPHAPYVAVAPYDEKHLQLNSDVLGGSIKLYFSDTEDSLRDWQDKEEMDKKQKYISDLYDAGLALADEFFGRVIETLKKEDLYDNTLIIVSSDHGEQFWEHGKYGHGFSLYDEELMVPLLIKFPENVSANTSSDRFSLGIDLLPTILHLNNIPIPAYFSGSSLLKPGNDGAKQSDFKFFFQNHPDFAEAVIFGDYKYIAYRGGGRGELYNITKDPKERVNLVDSEPEMVLMAVDAIKHFYSKAKSSGLEDTEKSKRWSVRQLDEKRPSVKQGLAPEMEDATLKRLKELGYMK